MKPVRTWVVIADSSRAKVVETTNKGRDVVPVEDMTFSAELPPSREIVSDKPGRSFESYGHARHSVHAPDPHRELKRAFAKSLAGALHAKFAEGRFDNLFVIAPPEMLGHLREALPKEVMSKVSGDLAQDLVKLPIQKLHLRLESLLRPR